jgi:hypothetical protein
MPSTAIRRFSYDDDSRTLFVTFTSGDLYAYLDVPRAVHAAFEDALSKGRFFGEAIRDRYRYVKMPSAAAVYSG